MFIFTAKLNKKLIGYIILMLVLIVVAIIVLASVGSTAEASEFSSRVKTNEERVAYLTSLGWDVAYEPVDQQDIIIPEDFSGVYGDYNELQKAQGFDLRDYSGFSCTRYTYSVLNHPSGDASVVADLIIYKNEVIAGDIQSTSLDGFMEGLEYPEMSTSPISEE